jgi:aryl-alcohol dehydrogenase-like predicted oxidoreductase
VYCLDNNDIGHNERLICKALKTWPYRHEVWVTTKGGLERPGGDWTENAKPKDLRKACESSLKALGVEHIFLYQLHAPDSRVPLEDSVGEISRLHEEGKVLHVGVSNVSVDELGRAQSVTRIETVQNRFNPMCQRDSYNGVLDACKAQGVTYIAYSPVGGGYQHIELAQHELLVELAQKHGATPYQVMLSWCLSKGEHVLPIPGASKIKSILDSVASVGVTLSLSEIKRIDEIEAVA